MNDTTGNEPIIRRILNQAYPQCGTLEQRTVDVLSKCIAELKHGSSELAEMIVTTDAKAKEIWDNATR